MKNILLKFKNMQEGKCTICGQDSEYNRCNSCDGRLVARKTFLYWFVERLRLYKRYGDTHEEINEDMMLLNFESDQRIKNRLGKLEQKCRNYVLSSESLRQHSDSEKNEFWQAYSTERQTLHANSFEKGMRVIHFNPESGKFSGHNIDWVEDMRYERGYSVAV